MKKGFCFGLFLVIAAVSIFAETNMLKAFEKSYKEKESAECLDKGLKKMGINILKEIPDENLSIINFILKNTHEINIHRMRGENENEIYVNEDGREAVYDKNGKLVTNSWNKGSFNYASYDKPIDKFNLDIFPWMIWGNAKDDPTTFDERLYYYCMDLDYGIQSYIFLEDKSVLEKISFSDLSDDEKKVYHLFNYLIFNGKYKVQLCEENIQQLQDSADFYWEYFYQIMDLIGFKSN
ncbi:MAG: hypothetical protein PUC37_12550 [Spirochaetales bacterium]|nr:hypothetical protein [Spirochaetales bacterium]